LLIAVLIGRQLKARRVDLFVGCQVYYKRKQNFAGGGMQFATPFDIRHVSMRLLMKLTLTRVLSASCVAAVVLVTQTARGSDASSTVTPCGHLVGAQVPGGQHTGFVLRNGEAVDFVSGGKTTHGTLLVLRDGSLYRAYWQPTGSPEKYVLADAGTGSVRLISTPPQGVPAGAGQPGIAVGQLQVLSCPAL
jgi:hypothetical protein